MTATGVTARSGDGGSGPEPVPEPNRPPVATGAVPAQSLSVGQPVQVDVAPFLSDPDGDALTLTAADPDGLAATQSASVTVRRDGGGGGAFRELDKPIASTSWTIGARLGRAAASGLVSVVWDTGLDRRTRFRFDIGDSRGGDSCYLWVWDEEHSFGPGWYSVVSDPGKSDAVHDGPNELTAIAFGWQGEDFVAVAGDTELSRARPNQDFNTEHGGNCSVTVAQITGISLVREDYSFGDASAGLFDRVEVVDPSSSAASR